MIEVLKAGNVHCSFAMYGKCPSCGCILRCTDSEVDRDRYIRNKYEVACPMFNCDHYVPVEYGDKDHPLYREAIQ